MRRHAAKPFGQVCSLPESVDRIISGAHQFFSVTGRSIDWPENIDFRALALLSQQIVAHFFWRHSSDHLQARPFVFRSEKWYIHPVPRLDDIYWMMVETVTHARLTNAVSFTHPSQKSSRSPYFWNQRWPSPPARPWTSFSFQSSTGPGIFVLTQWEGPWCQKHEYWNLANWRKTEPTNVAERPSLQHPESVEFVLMHLGAGGSTTTYKGRTGCKASLGQNRNGETAYHLKRFGGLIDMTAHNHQLSPLRRRGQVYHLFQKTTCWRVSFQTQRGGSSKTHIFKAP